MSKLTLSEAAAEILQNSVKNAGSEPFGVGKKPNAKTPGQNIQDLGQAGHKTTDNNYDGTKGVPTATPPGAKPPVGSEPMKKLPSQPQQTMGRSDLAGSPEGSETSETDKVDRKKGPTSKQTFDANKNAVKPFVPESEEEEEFEPEPEYDEDELEEATMEEVQKDLQELSDAEFQKKYGASKKDVIAKIKQLQAQQQTQKNEENEVVEDYPPKFGNYRQTPIKNQVQNIANKAKMKKTVPPKPEVEPPTFKEDIDAMLAGENLSEEFKEKATIIFEAAVNSRIESLKEELEQHYITEFENAVETIKEDFSEKLDSYLDYVVENWMEENKLAVEKGLRTEIAEDFMSALRNVFVEHYIEIPDEKVDLVDGLVEKVESLEESLNTEISRNVELKKRLSEHKKEEVIHSVSEGLTLSQVEKIRSLANGVEFISEEDYESKLITIRENYFPSLVKSQKSNSMNEPVELDESLNTTKVVDPVIESYVNKISKQLKF